jgi:uncharacterized protein YeaO (DUF488 family)
MLAIHRHLRNIRSWLRSFSSMKTEKRPPGGVSDMDVLKDLRSLISPDKAPSPEPRRPGEEEAVKYRELVREQQEEIEQLKREKEALLRKLDSRTVSAAAGQGKDEETVSLEERKRKLTEALAEAEDVLRLRTEDILRKMAQAMVSMGSMDMGMELYRTASSLEKAECFACFLEVFLREE